MPRDTRELQVGFSCKKIKSKWEGGRGRRGRWGGGEGGGKGKKERQEREREGKKGKSKWELPNPVYNFFIECEQFCVTSLFSQNIDLKADVSVPILLECHQTSALSRTS